MSEQRTPTLATLIRDAITKRLVDVHTALPGRVETFDAATQRADVKPQVRAPARDESGAVEFLPLPVIQAVPVQFPGAGAFRITFPVGPGTTGLLVFSESSIEKWLETGRDVSPEDVRRHHLADAVFIPGLNPDSGTWTADGSVITIGSESGAEDWVARAGRVDDALQELKAELAGWTPVANDGGLALKTKLTALFAKGWPETTASATVKIKG